MVCLGHEPGAAGWRAQTNPLSYGGTPFKKITSEIKTVDYLLLLLKIFSCFEFCSKPEFSIFERQKIIKVVWTGLIVNCQDLFLFQQFCVRHHLGTCAVLHAGRKDRQKKNKILESRERFSAASRGHSFFPGAAASVESSVRMFAFCATYVMHRQSDLDSSTLF